MVLNCPAKSGNAQESGFEVLFKPYFGNCVCIGVTMMKIGEYVPIESLVYNN